MAPKRKAPLAQTEATTPVGGEKRSKKNPPPLPQECHEVVDEELLTSAIPDTVVKVFCTHCEPNFSQPWTTRRQTGSSSSGFVTRAGKNNQLMIITNAHSVEYAAVVQVRKRGDHEKYGAKVECVGFECDLALLSVQDEEFWKDLAPLEWGPSPELMDPVTVVGYPVGGDNTSVTQGVVSRIDLQQYSLGGSNLLAIQIDAAINPGNSGGPALNKSRQCVGIAFQSLKEGDTENIGYIIPSEVANHFLTDYKLHDSFTGFGDPGFSWQRLENKSMRKALGLTQKHHGVLVKKVEQARKVAGVLKAGDIILKVNGQPVASDGSVPFRSRERVAFTWLMSQMYARDVCKVQLQRTKEIVDVEFEIEKLDLLVPANIPEGTKPEYLIAGGLVFVPMTEPLLRSEYGDQFEYRAPVRFLERWQYGSQDAVDQRVVILSHVLAHELTVGIEHLSNTILHSFNGTKVMNLKHLDDLMLACEDQFYRFDLDYEETAVIEAKAAKAALAEVMERNLIPVEKHIGQQRSPEVQPQAQEPRKGPARRRGAAHKEG